MKIQHILKSMDFAEVLKNGKKRQEDIVAMHFLKDERKGRVSVGVIISKKNVPKAVTRNYLRRIIYAFFTEQTTRSNDDKKIVVRITRPIGNVKKGTLSKKVREEMSNLL